MAEMLATCNARSVEEIKSFLSRQSETYKVPCLKLIQEDPGLDSVSSFGSSNNADFLPFDESGNRRRFIPIFVDKDKAEHHPLEDEDETRNYIEQVWGRNYGYVP